MLVTFREMFIHHMTTIGLMVLSWSVNLTRVGTLVLLIHDCADIFLEVSEFAMTLDNYRASHLMLDWVGLTF